MSSTIIFKIFHEKAIENYNPSELYRDYLLREVNEDIEQRLRYFHINSCAKMDILALVEMPSKKIIAATGMGIAHLEKNVVLTYFISVDPDYRKMGFARKLVRERFELMRKKYPGKILELSGYTIMGDLFVKPLIQEISKDYPDIVVRDKACFTHDSHVHKAMRKALEERRSFVDVDEFA